jgi:hypothetical protein
MQSRMSLATTATRWRSYEEGVLPVGVPTPHHGFKYRLQCGRDVVVEPRPHDKLSLGSGGIAEMPTDPMGVTLKPRSRVPQRGRHRVAVNGDGIVHVGSVAASRQGEHRNSTRLSRPEDELISAL